MTALIAAAVNQGIGLYDAAIPSSTIAKLVVANNDIWVLTVNITKASILMQYLRIFAGLKTRLCCYSLLLALLPALLWALLRGTLLCTPARKLWSPSTQGTCASAQTYWLSVAGLDIGLDILVLLLPLPCITRLRLPRKQKLNLLAVFTLGFLVCAVSIARLLTVYLVSRAGDHVGSGVWSIIWSSVEANVGIICACLLALKPLLSVLCPRLVEDSQEGIPRHCMRIRQISVAAAGAAWPGDEATLVPDSPVLVRKGSRSEGGGASCSSQRCSTLRTPSTSDAGGMASLGGGRKQSLYLPRPAPVHLEQGQGEEREVVDLLDMLRGAEVGI